jgi:hypothetical protein
VSIEATRDNEVSETSIAGEVTTTPLGHISRAQLAKWTGKSSRFWLRLERAGEGPPITYLGKTPTYRLNGVLAWLAAKEESALRRGRKTGRRRR